LKKLRHKKEISFLPSFLHSYHALYRLQSILRYNIALLIWHMPDNNCVMHALSFSNVRTLVIYALFGVDAGARNSGGGGGGGGGG